MHVAVAPINVYSSLSRTCLLQFRKQLHGFDPMRIPSLNPYKISIVRVFNGSNLYVNATENFIHFQYDLRVLGVLISISEKL